MPPSTISAPAVENHGSPPPAPLTNPATRGVTPRVIVVCLLLALGLGYAIPVVDYKFFNTFLGATHLPPGALAALLAMVLVVNPLLRLMSGKLAFSRNETLTVYLSCLFSCLVPGIGGNNYFVSFIIGGFYYATRENRWFDYLKGLPPWFTPALNSDGTYNAYVVDAWYNGIAGGTSIPWGAWIVPLCAWGAFFFASFCMLGCLSVMLAAQWGDREALAFPLLRLPVQMTETEEETKTPFFRNPLMWCGFAAAAVLQALNGLNLYYPEIPRVSTYISSGPLFTEAPWNQIGDASLVIYPIGIGIAYLLTTEVSFSFWFFFWLLKLQLMACYYMGFMPAALPQMIGGGGARFLAYQEVGANFMYVALIVWAARRHLAHIAKRAFGRTPATEEEKLEAMPYPLAFWGFLASFAFMVTWGVAAGMSLTLSTLLWTMYLVIAVVLSRVVAEGGLLFVPHTWMPLGSLAPLLGMGPSALLNPGHGLNTAAFMEFTTIQDYRGNLMPSFVQSFKLARDRGIAARPLCGLIFGVILVGMLMGFSMNVRLGYENGGLGLQGWLSKWGPQGAGRNMASIAALNEPIDPLSWGWLGMGMVITLTIVALRSRFAWMPLHPLGYIMANTYPMRALWFSIFVGWLCKVVISRYGGYETARKNTPLFLGLAMGDVASMLFWIVIDGWQGHTGHQLMPG